MTLQFSLLIVLLQTRTESVHCSTKLMECEASFFINMFPCFLHNRITYAQMGYSLNDIFANKDNPVIFFKWTKYRFHICICCNEHENENEK